MLSQELEFCLNDAFAGAREARHEFMTVEHLLLAIVDTPKVREVLKSCGADTAKLKTELKQFIDQTTPRLPAGEDRDVQPTLGFQRVLQRAVFHVQSSGKKEVTVANVLVAIFSEKQSHAAYLLSMQDVSRLDVVNFIAHGLSKAGGEERSDREEGGASTDAEREGDGGGNALEKYATNLNDSARKGKIDPLIGRKLEVERTIEILCRTAQEQSPVRGRGRRRQDGDRGGSRPHDRREPGARRAAGCNHLFARHGFAGRRHQVSRRFREAPEGGARRGQEAAGRDSVHRRNPHRHRRRRGIGRRDGCLESDQARPGQRRPALHRFDHLQRISRHLREGSCAGAPLPENRHHRAVGSGHGGHSARPEVALRGASRHQVRGRCVARGRGARGAAHQRSAHAGQGDRRRR